MILPPRLQAIRTPRDMDCEKRLDIIEKRLDEIVQFLDRLAGLRININRTDEKAGFYGTTPVAQGAALTTKNTDTAASGDATTDGIIDNNRDRIAEIETILANLGVNAGS